MLVKYFRQFYILDKYWYDRTSTTVTPYVFTSSEREKGLYPNRFLNHYQIDIELCIWNNILCKFWGK